MTAAQRRQLQALLERLRDEIGGRGPKRIEPNRTSDAQVGGDEDEQPLNEMLQSIASDRNRNAGAVLAKVEKALKKLAEDPESFGECEECGEEISFARLKAMPYAELCVGCQSKKDGPRSGPTRRKVTDYR